MPTRQQSPHPSGQVFSVRLPRDIVERLDALAEHAGRSRGLYVRLALTAMLPPLEADHWNQKTAHYEQDLFEQEFVRITTDLITNTTTEKRAEDPSDNFAD